MFCYPIIVEPVPADALTAATGARGDARSRCALGAGGAGQLVLEARKGLRAPEGRWHFWHTLASVRLAGLAKISA
jgi:hypothetical protein